MKKKLGCVILIDDSAPTNHLHQMVLEEYGLAEKIITFQWAEQALDFLKSNVNTPENQSNYLKPDILFLDINMPRMNGWEFLEEYLKLPIEQRSRVMIFLLTTSLNEDDKNKASLTPDLSGFYNKPLTKELLDDIIRKFFPELL